MDYFIISAGIAVTVLLLAATVNCIWSRLVEA